jgi:predicted amidohydrolase YtcJ
MLHVVGDSSVVLVLDAMAPLAPDAVWRTKRLRLAHVSLLQGPLIARARRIGVLIVVGGRVVHSTGVVLPPR